MDRLTKAVEGKNFYITDDTNVEHDEKGYHGTAITKLAKFENIYDNLISKQVEITKEMEKLRSEGKTNTVKFKQLFAEKLTNNNIISIFETYIS